MANMGKITYGVTVNYINNMDSPFTTTDSALAKYIIDSVLREEAVKLPTETEGTYTLVPFHSIASVQYTKTYAEEEVEDAVCDYVGESSTDYNVTANYIANGNSGTTVVELSGYEPTVGDKLTLTINGVTKETFLTFACNDYVQSFECGGGPSEGVFEAAAYAAGTTITFIYGFGFETGNYPATVKVTKATAQ